MLVFMLILMVVPVIVVMLFLLHAFYDLLLPGAVPQRIQQAYHDHVLIYGFFQGAVYPAVRFSADVYKKIAGRDRQNILCCRLIAVQIDPAVHQRGHLHPAGIFAENVHHPVIFGIDRGHDADAVRLPGLCSCCRGKDAKSCCRKGSGKISAIFHYFLSSASNL